MWLRGIQHLHCGASPSLTYQQMLLGSCKGQLCASGHPQAVSAPLSPPAPLARLRPPCGSCQ